MKSGEIKIFDTKTGVLIVPYFQKGNIVYLSSYSNGNLAFIDLQGKISVINVHEKSMIFENSDAVKNLLLTLNNKSKLTNKHESEGDNEEESEGGIFISSFYLSDTTIYIEVMNEEDDDDKQNYVYNNELKLFEKVDPISSAIINDSNSSNIARVQKDAEMEADVAPEEAGIGLNSDDRDKSFFYLSEDKQELIDELGLALSDMEKSNRPKNYENNNLIELEARIMLYERLEHKEEYFINLEAYLIKIIKQGDTDRIKKLISKFDSQYGVHKKLKLETTGYDDFIMGIKKSKILDDFIKPKIRIQENIYQYFFKNK